MIEFRAECGHTIRARNEDAGKLVNCAYCGKKALVPSEETDPMDSLLADTLEESREVAEEPDRAVPWGKGLGMAPLRIAWTAIFVVLVLSVLLLTVRWVYREVAEDTQVWETDRALIPRGGVPAEASRLGTSPEGRPERPAVEQEPPGPPPPRRRNLLADLDARSSGVCVFSVPPHLDVYVENASVQGDMRLRADGFVGRTSAEEGLVETLASGQSYRVSVVANVRNPDLRDYAEYPSRELLDRARRGDFEGAADLAEEYFIEDGAQEWKVEKRGPHFYLIKTYQIDRLGREGDWRPIYSLFVPRVSCAELLSFVPAESRFVYDQRYAKQELRDLSIAPEDFPTVLTVLSRMGKAVVTDTQAGMVKVFQVWPDMSVVGEPLISEQIPPEL